MKEGSKKQLKVASLIQFELNLIFQKLNFGIIYGSLVSISVVKITSDLLDCRVYLSVYNSDETQKNLVLEHIKNHLWEIKKKLYPKIKNQLRIMPEVKFFIDTKLDYVFNIESLLNEIKSNKLP